MKLNFKKLLGEKLYNFFYQKYITRSLLHTIKCIDAKDGTFDAKSGTDFLFSEDAVHIKPMQYPEELVQLAQAIYDKKPKVIL